MIEMISAISAKNANTAAAVMSFISFLCLLLANLGTPIIMSIYITSYENVGGLKDINMIFGR
nr:782_t:CDS:2 [Entrophospora candida]